MWDNNNTIYSLILMLYLPFFFLLCKDTSHEYVLSCMCGVVLDHHFLLQCGHISYVRPEIICHVL